MTAFPWCAALAAMSDDDFGAVLRAVGVRHAARSPEVLRLGHRRAHALAEVTYQEGGKTVRVERSEWHLHVGVVLDGEHAADARDLADTHPALARDILAEALRWCDAWPNLHRHGRGDAALRSYHRAPLDVVVPDAPPVHARHRFASEAPVAPARRAEPEPPKASPVAVPEQKGLFG